MSSTKNSNIFSINFRPYCNTTHIIHYQMVNGSEYSKNYFKNIQLNNSCNSETFKIRQTAFLEAIHFFSFLDFFKCKVHIGIDIRF